MWLILAVTQTVAGRYWRRKRAARNYAGSHRRNDAVAYEKRYDWGYAKKALGHYFEMPVDYVYS